MSTSPSATPDSPHSPQQQLDLARQVLRGEAAGIVSVADSLGQPFCDAVDMILSCRGNVIVSGMGKAGLIGQKIVATLGSTGTSSHFLHPGEAVHGDLGRIHSQDIVLAMSFSGGTDEVLRLISPLRHRRIPLLVITGKATSPLGKAAHVLLDIGSLEEACPLGLAPSTSTTAMLALGDALALVVSRSRGFAADDFARFHPAGSLGRQLLNVEDVMRPLSECRLASPQLTVRQVYTLASRPGRRSGAVMLTDEDGKLTGIFTDSDLARLLEQRRDRVIDEPVGSVMSSRPTTITKGTRMVAALQLLGTRMISELPVVDAAGRPLGMIDITDAVRVLSPQPALQVQPPLSDDSSSATDLARPSQSDGHYGKDADDPLPITLPFRTTPPGRDVHED